MDNPAVIPSTKMASLFYSSDVFFTLLFSTELLLKVFVFGLYSTPEAYLKSGWNVLDAVIVFTSVPSVLFPSLSDLQGVRVLRALRALRPLVLIKRLKGLRQVDGWLRSRRQSRADASSPLYSSHPSMCGFQTVVDTALERA